MANQDDQPRQPKGSPGAGQWDAISGAEAGMSLLDQVGASVDSQLRSILAEVMVSRHLGDPSNASDEETLRAAEDYMQLEEFNSISMQARHAIEDVRNASELDVAQVRISDPDAAARLREGGIMSAVATVAGRRHEGEVFRSATTGKVWFLPFDPYPAAYRGDSINEKALRLARHSYVHTLNLDAADDDNDYDLVYELAGADDAKAQKTWDFMRCVNDRGTTVEQALHFAQNAEPMQIQGLLTADEHAAAVRTGFHKWVGDRRLHVFGNSGRPDHVWGTWVD